MSSPNINNQTQLILPSIEEDTDNLMNDYDEISSSIAFTPTILSRSSSNIPLNSFQYTNMNQFNSLLPINHKNMYCSKLNSITESILITMKCFKNMNIPVKYKIYFFNHMLREIDEKEIDTIDKAEHLFKTILPEGGTNFTLLKDFKKSNKNDILIVLTDGIHDSYYYGLNNTQNYNKVFDYGLALGNDSDDKFLSKISDKVLKTSDIDEGVDFILSSVREDIVNVKHMKNIFIKIVYETSYVKDKKIVGETSRQGLSEEKLEEYIYTSNQSNVQENVKLNIFNNFSELYCKFKDIDIPNITKESTIIFVIDNSGSMESSLIENPYLQSSQVINMQLISEKYTVINCQIDKLDENTHLFFPPNIINMTISHNNKTERVDIQNESKSDDYKELYFELENNLENVIFKSMLKKNSYSTFENNKKEIELMYNKLTPKMDYIKQIQSIWLKNKFDSLYRKLKDIFLSMKTKGEQFVLQPVDLNKMQRQVSSAITRELSCNTYNPIESITIDCPICYNEINTIILPCNHLICETCLINTIDNNHKKCPLCRVNIENNAKFTIKNTTCQKTGCINDGKYFCIDCSNAISCSGEHCTKEKHTSEEIFCKACKKYTKPIKIFL